MQDLIKDSKEEKIAEVKPHSKEMPEPVVSRVILDNMEGLVCHPVGHVTKAARKAETEQWNITLGVVHPLRMWRKTESWEKKKYCT